MNNLNDTKYCMSKFANMNDLESAIMADGTMSDMEKLARIFHNNKEDVKKKFPQLYYAILGVLDSVKDPTPTTIKMWVDTKAPPSHYDTFHEWVWCKTVNGAKTVIEAHEDAYRPVALIDIGYDAGEHVSEGGQYIELLKWLKERNSRYLITTHHDNCNYSREMIDLICEISKYDIDIKN